IFNKAFFLLHDLMIYRPLKTSKNIGTCIAMLFHMILLIINYVVDLNNNITIEIIHRLVTNMTIRAFLHFLYFLEVVVICYNWNINNFDMAEAPFLRKKELTMACCVFLHKEKHVSMNKVRVKKGNLVLDMYRSEHKYYIIFVHYMYSVYMYICLCTYVFIIRMHDKYFEHMYCGEGIFITLNSNSTFGKH
ncbi:hypothetical protein ACJX0J_039177, partial [Zea mays]